MLLPKIDQQAIPQILGDITVKTADDPGAQFLVGADDFAQVLGIKLLRQGGRPHQITEHDGQLAPLGLGRARPALAAVRPCLVRLIEPDQHQTVFILGHPLGGNEFDLERLKRAVIQLKLALQRAVGHPPTLGQQAGYLIDDLEERHGGSIRKSPVR